MSSMEFRALAFFLYRNSLEFLKYATLFRRTLKEGGGWGRGQTFLVDMNTIWMKSSLSQFLLLMNLTNGFGVEISDIRD